MTDTPPLRSRPAPSTSDLPRAARLRLAKSSAFALLTVAVAACGHAPGGTLPEPPAFTARAALAERVESAAATELAGAVAARRTATVSARVLATVTAVRVELGGRVRAGETLLEVDPTVARGQLGQARGGLAQAEAALALAKRNAGRFEALAANGSASELELDQARLALRQAEGAVEQAKGGVSAAGSIVGDARVVAPFSGRVAALLVEVGDLVAPGRPLATIDSDDGRRFVVAIPESLVAGAALAPGTTISVRLDARADLGPIAGRLAELSPGPDPASHSYTAKIDLPATLDVAAGASGRAALAGAPRSRVVVPREALVEAGGLLLVVVRDDEGRAASRVVTVGREVDDGRIEVLSGLTGGETVALGLAAAPATGAPFEIAAAEVSR